MTRVQIIAGIIIGVLLFLIAVVLIGLVSLGPRTWLAVGIIVPFWILLVREWLIGWRRLQNRKD